MGRKGIKIANETKLKYAKLCFENKMSKCEAARILDTNDTEVLSWVYRYAEQGELTFLDTGKNNVYSSELKLSAVKSYLDGEGSYKFLTAKYGLRSTSQLRRWVKMYNNGEDFLHKMSGGSRMKTSRKTTKEERIQIVKECLENDCNYGEVAIKHNVSYQQVYGWVKRFKELGEAGLEDRRGRRKVDQEPRSEVEELKIKMAQLEHELYMTKMERDLLKKVKELERKDLYRK
ncbi:MAG: transposase [Mogibacterium sp.]|nr:transposase [Mogibacterium sp.]